MRSYFFVTLKDEKLPQSKFYFSLIIIVSCNINDISKPNVILIMADDIGYEALSINGANDIRTPLDSLAKWHKL